MMKQNKGKGILSSILILLPVLFGVLLRDKLPASMPIHWGVDGKADGWGSPLVMVFFLPVFLLALHWLCLWFTARDNKKNDQSKKVVGMVFWICPIISLVTSGMFYAIAFGATVHMSAYVSLVLGLSFILIGNYLPKCRPNRTIGVKIKWTLANEENWNRTHRLAGKVTVIAGVLCLPAAFLPMTVFPWVIFVLIAAVVVIPTVYSYRLYKKHLREGTVTKEDYNRAPTKGEMIAKWTMIPLVILILVFCLVICFTGDIAVAYEEAAFTVEATFYDDLRLNYADIDEIEYRTSDAPGERVSGFGSPRLLMGWFRNEEFGDYTRYSYTGADACVVITSDGKTLVIGLADEAATRSFYEFLMEKVGG